MSASYLSRNNSKAIALYHLTKSLFEQAFCNQDGQINISYGCSRAGRTNEKDLD